MEPERLVNKTMPVLNKKGFLFMDAGDITHEDLVCMAQNRCCWNNLVGSL